MSFATQAGNIQGSPLGIGHASTSVLVGIDAYPVSVEACCTRGPAFFQMVGLAEAAVREARVRVASALSTLGLLLDEYAITVNLAPADLRKGTTALDLPLAVAVLQAIGAMPPQAPIGALLLGELGLGGELRPVRGVLAHIDSARARGVKEVVIPRQNSREAGHIKGVAVRVASSLLDVLEAYRSEHLLPLAQQVPFSSELPEATYGDLADVRGQLGAKRALEIAAAGEHNLLMIGAPGAGKTLLARLLPTLCAPLTFEEAVEVTKIHSVAGLLDPGDGIVRRRPFRSPHHSVSEAGLIGGGEVPRPGEVSLAHRGVLFLDELTEFRRTTLEALRLPLEDGAVSVVRAKARALFPCRPLVVAAANPCPCGYLAHPKRACRCLPKQLAAYRARLSGPIVDRLDVHVSVPPVEPRALVGPAHGESSSLVRERVQKARQVQRERAERLGLSAKRNADLSLRDLERIEPLDAECKRLIECSMNELGLSARAYVKVLRIARTIADLGGAERTSAEHVAEAIQCRLLDHRH